VTTRHHTEVTERSPMDGWDDGTRGFPLFFRMYYSPSFNTNQPKVHVVREGYYVAFTINIRLNRRSTRLEVTIEN
jgi:hypothetical protein